VWPFANFYANWAGRVNFAEVLSGEKYSYDNNNVFFEKNYDALIEASVPVLSFAKATPSMIVRGQASIGAANDIVVVGYGTQKRKNITNSVGYADQIGEAFVDTVPPNEEEQITVAASQIRKNFNETAFFFPDLKTDSAGNISFSFTMPEALTKWKFQALAHTKDLSIYPLVTQQ
jgi:hypothetical protein